MSSVPPNSAVANVRFLTPLLAPLLFAACIQTYPQRLPGPLFVPADAGPGTAPPAAAQGGPTVTVQRDSDPVWVRFPGERGERALQFHAKRERVPLGTLVRTGAGGRAEILWSPDATSLALFDETRATLGDPSRDEPLVSFHAVARALLVLTPEDRIEILGGARLAGDALETTGPILLEEIPGGLLRVCNQSKRLVSLAYRDERLELGPGESLDLPVLAGGAAPAGATPEPQRFEVAGIPVALQGRVERRDQGMGVSLTALEPARVQALGVEVRLPPDGTARFSGLSQVPGARPADPNGQP